MDKRLKTLFILGAVLCAASSIYLSYTYEPDIETIKFDATSDEGHLTSSAASYKFAFTGDLADIVTWDFGDDTGVEAFEVIKEYDPGTYYITCTAENMWGVRVSAYQLTVEPESFGFWDGHEDALVLALISVSLMAVSYAGHRGWL